MSAPVLKWRWLRPSHIDGIALFFVILIRPGLSARQRETLLQHERVHIRQQRDGWWLGFAWRYLTSRRWQLIYEAEAYAVDYRAGRNVEDILNQLQGHAGRRYSREECRACLMGFV